jgi:hypothetical protein
VALSRAGACDLVRPTGWLGSGYLRDDCYARLSSAYEESYAEEWRAIEDGERDAAAEEAEQSCHEGDGYTSDIFIEAYIRRLRSEGHWQVIAEHPCVAELVRHWAHQGQGLR